MKTTLATLCVLAFVTACGGGGSADPLPDGNVAAELEEKKARSALPAVLPGDPATRSIGTHANGRTTIAWVSSNDAYVQQFNKAGAAMGDAIKLPIPAQEYPYYNTAPAVVVQSSGDVAVLYQRIGPATEDNIWAIPLGAYLQRFAADGTLLQGETEVVSMHQYDEGSIGKGRQELVQFRLLALSDGSFVASWGVRYGGCFSCGTVEFFMQRFDKAGRPSTEIFHPVRNVLWIYLHNSFFEWEADEKGGFTVVGTYFDRGVDGTSRPLPVQETTHYPKGQKGPKDAKPAKGR